MPAKVLHSAVSKEVFHIDGGADRDVGPGGAVGAVVASIVMAGAARGGESPSGGYKFPPSRPSPPTTHHPPTVARPRSVITKRTTPNDRPRQFGTALAWVASRRGLMGGLACGFALANAGHDTRSLQAGISAIATFSAPSGYTERAPDRFKDFWR